MNQIPPNYYQNNTSQNNHQQNLDNQSQQICLSHHQLWSHACLSSSCSLQPLCGKCIKQHNQFHKDKNQYPEIETIEDIKHECLKLNENIIQLYEKELDYVQQTIKQKGYDPSIQFETLQGIRKVKDLIQEQIDFYFQQLEGQFQNYQSTIDNHEQIKQKEKKYKKEIEELQQQIYKIKNEKTDILLLKKIMNQKPDDQINQFKFTNSVNLFNLQNNSQYKCFIDPSYKIKLTDFLKQIIYLQKENDPSNYLKNFENDKYSYNPPQNLTSFQQLDRSQSPENYFKQLQQSQNNKKSSQQNQDNNNQNIRENNNNKTSNNIKNKSNNNDNVLNQNTNIQNQTKQTHFQSPSVSQLQSHIKQNQLYNNENNQNDTSTQSKISPSNFNKFQSKLFDKEKVYVNPQNNEEIQKNLEYEKNLVTSQIKYYRQQQQNNNTNYNNNNNNKNNNNSNISNNQTVNYNINFPTEIHPQDYVLATPDKSRHTLNNPANIYRDSIGKQLAFNNQIENLHAHKDEDFEINVQDYFEKECNKSFLHFFQHKSKIFHFVNLEDLKMGLPPKFYQINLNLNFNIPRWHKSISLPDGQVVITGGVSCEIKDKKLNNCYQLDYTNRKLLPIPSMILARSGHSLVYFQEEIYAIGGFSEQMIFTSRCEKFSFTENKWIEIAELNQRANNPTVCSFNNKYIFKFGGKFDDNKLNQFVEKYDPKINKWQIIQFSCPSFLTPNQTLLTSACCIQINRSQILIFGGTQENYTAKSDNCYIFQVDHNGDTGEQTNFSSEDFKQNPQLIQFSVKRFGEKSLPNKDGFWNNQAIIYKNKLYCLQNVSSEDKQQAVYLDRRRVLSFDSQKWVSLNKYELKEFNSNKVGSVIFQ